MNELDASCRRIFFRYQEVLAKVNIQVLLELEEHNNMNEYPSVDCLK